MASGDQRTSRRKGRLKVSWENPISSSNSEIISNIEEEETIQSDSQNQMVYFAELKDMEQRGDRMVTTQKRLHILNPEVLEGSASSQLSSIRGGDPRYAELPCEL